jgi:hypothetical protein
MEAEGLPWSRVNVDLIGPYIVHTPTTTHTLRALTMIDPVANWFEVTDIADKNASTVMEAFNNTWLTRYPQPQYIGYDNGSEFKAQFREMCDNYGMKENHQLVTIRNQMVLQNVYIKYSVMHCGHMNLKMQNSIQITLGTTS